MIYMPLQTNYYPYFCRYNGKYHQKTYTQRRLMAGLCRSNDACSKLPFHKRRFQHIAVLPADTYPCRYRSSCNCLEKRQQILKTSVVKRSDNLCHRFASVTVKPFVYAVAHLYCHRRIKKISRTYLYCSSPCH